MKKISKGLLFALAAVSATSALAQYPGGGTPRGGLLGRPSTNDSQRIQPKENTVDQLEYRMYQLHADLRLTPVQDMAWGAFSDKVKAMVADITREQQRATASGTLNSMKQIEQTTDSIRNRLTALEDISAVARLLYDGLNEEQKTTADPRLASIVQIAMRIEGATPDIVAAPELDSTAPAPPKPPKIHFGPPPAPDPSARTNDVGH
jgi:LTXXQ motif family protein